MNGAAAPTADIDAPRRALITVSVMLASIMSALDITIANVALPRIQGSVSATQDQMAWVLTSYIVAAAIMTPLSGWLAGQIGRKKVFLYSITGFTLASMLCGVAQSLPQIVLARLIQGLCGAALIPLSQAVLRVVATEAGAHLYFLLRDEVAAVRRQALAMVELEKLVHLTEFLEKLQAPLRPSSASQRRAVHRLSDSCSG